MFDGEDVEIDPDSAPDDNLTLSRDHPVSEFIRQNKTNLSSMTQEQFEEKLRAHSNDKKTILGETATSLLSSRADTSSNLEAIVLKFTTLSENCSETPSFIVTQSGARIGQSSSNEISVPSDGRLASEAHSTIEYADGAFYLVDGGYDFSASIRIGIGGHQQRWILRQNARFSAGNSVFHCLGEDAEGRLMIDVLEGPIKGTRRLIMREGGATIGRSSENAISVPDRELSRKHSRMEFDPALQAFVVQDLGSTNGTYMQLVGPYSGRYRLCLSDHILIGRTGFSINRFDYGLSEEMGHRQSMEDACAIVQHLGVPFLSSSILFPQSYFAIYDGHGGGSASLFLSQHLHINIGVSLTSTADTILRLVNSPEFSFDEAADGSVCSALSQMDDIVKRSLKECFLSTDADFLASSQTPQQGSTATTALILGCRLYCANVGDSRTLLCRNFQPKPMSHDHKPGREDESKRIRDVGGFVINNRVMGELAVSRAFGDSEFKKGIRHMIEEVDEGDQNTENWDQPLIIAEPDFECATITENDQFVILACDGLFDVFTEAEVVSFVLENMQEHRDAQKCCQNLTYEAIKKRNSRDNVSVILVILNKWY